MVKAKAIIGLCLPVILWLLAAPLTRGAAFSENFATNPADRGWRVFGDSSLFHWNATNQNLEVTWDSSRSNSFFFFPLGTVLAKSDDFSFSFEVRLSDIRAGTTPGKTKEFEIAMGLINYRSATNSKAFRGAGVSPTYGVRNIVEFDYFPDAGFGDTFSTTVISTNNAFAYYNNDPLEMAPYNTYRISMAYTASNQLLRTSATRNGLPFDALGDVSLSGKPDFRVDAFAITSYSDAVQTGSPAYYGSVLAHGAVDNVQWSVPPLPLGNVRLLRTNTVWLAELTSVSNWVYVLEGTPNTIAWEAVSSATVGNGGMLRLADTNAAVASMFYRVRAERP